MFVFGPIDTHKTGCLTKEKKLKNKILLFSEKAFVKETKQHIVVLSYCANKALLEEAFLALETKGEQAALASLKKTKTPIGFCLINKETEKFNTFCYKKNLFFSEDGVSDFLGGLKSSAALNKEIQATEDIRGLPVSLNPTPKETIIAQGWSYTVAQMAQKTIEAETGMVIDVVADTKPNLFDPEDEQNPLVFPEKEASVFSPVFFIQRYCSILQTHGLKTPTHLLQGEDKGIEEMAGFLKKTSVFLGSKDLCFLAQFLSLYDRTARLGNGLHFSTGELKHGPLALIEKGVAVVFLCGRHDRPEKILTNVQEVLARGAEVCVLSAKAHKEKFLKSGVKTLSVDEPFLVNAWVFMYMAITKV